MGIARIRVDSRGDIEVLEGILSSMREQVAGGDARAQLIVSVVEQMIAEREQQLGGDVEGPLANVRGERPDRVIYEGPAERLRDVWIAVRANLRAVLDETTLADLAAGELPSGVEEVIAQPEAWQPR